MGRKRKKEDQWMPPRVYKGKSAYEFRPSTGGAIRLCSLDASEDEVWASYNKTTKKPQQKNNVEALIIKFFGSEKFEDLAEETQSDYIKYSRRIISVFGGMAPDNIAPHHIKKYIDRRGKKSKTQANREKSFFSSVFQWAVEFGYVSRNPCRAVRQFKESARTRYVTDKEYKAVYDNACVIVRSAMEIAYRCAARQGDILKLTKDKLLDEGIFIKQGKTGVEQIKSWSPELAIASWDCENKSYSNSDYVIHKDDGSPLTRHQFNYRWDLARSKARDETGKALDFTFHDLKAKGISDYDGSTQEKQEFSGLKTEQQVDTYDRKVRVVQTITDSKS